MTTLTPEQREGIDGRIRLALRAVRSSNWPDTAKPVFKVLEEDIPALLAALKAAEERAEKAEEAAAVWRRAAAHSLSRHGVPTPVNLAANFYSSDLIAGIGEIAAERDALKAENERMREALEAAKAFAIAEQEMRGENDTTSYPPPFQAVPLIDTIDAALKEKPE